MAVYLVLAAITLALAFLVDREVEKSEKSFFEEPVFTRGVLKNKIIYAMIFFFLFGVSATRIAVGGDYWSYTSIFSLLAQNRDKSVATEVGFNILVKDCLIVENHAVGIKYDRLLVFLLSGAYCKSFRSGLLIHFLIHGFYLLFL